MNAPNWFQDDRRMILVRGLTRLIGFARQRAQFGAVAHARLAAAFRGNPLPT